MLFSAQTTSPDEFTSDILRSTCSQVKTGFRRDRKNGRSARQSHVQRTLILTAFATLPSTVDEASLNTSEPPDLPPLAGLV
jgi:hypothetical protein